MQTSQKLMWSTADSTDTRSTKRTTRSDWRCGQTPKHAAGVDWLRSTLAQSSRGLTRDRTGRTHGSPDGCRANWSRNR